MFTNFSQKLNGLFGIDGFPPEAAELIISVLTQCNADLEHRGDVEFPNLPDGGGGGTGIASYAVANATWTRASGHASSVTADPADAPDGTTNGEAAITILLPRYNTDKDPNVYAGDILAYQTINGVHYAVGEGHLDSPIGHVLLHTNATIPHGWALMSVAFGIEMNGQFPLGTNDFAELLTNGGGEDHYHDVRDTTVSVAAGSDYDVTSAIACPSGPKLRDADGNCQVGNADIRGPWVKFFYLIRIGPSGEIA